MNIIGLFRPKSTLSDEQVTRGLRWLTLEGMVSNGFASITSSGFLAAFALLLGANNLQVGILAALPFLAQLLQIPTILLVERLRRRKSIALSTWFAAQVLWVPIALIPTFLDVPSAAAISMLLVLVAFRSILHALSSCAWSGWIKDLIPQQILGSFMGRRLALANMVAMVFGMGAALFVEYWKGHAAAEAEALGYTFPLLLGALTLGMASPVFMTLMPEPLMQPRIGFQPSLVSTIAAPFRDRNYRHLLRFLFLWGLAINLATPFFAVYMLQSLGLSLTIVMALGLLSQVSSILFLRIWGPLADRFGSKAVLSVCVSLYLLVVLGWTFTTMPERYFLTIPLLIVLHILAGCAAAGVGLSTGTIGMKLAPQGEATSYLAGAALVSNLGAGLGPLLGGRFADFFSVRTLSLNFTWVDPSHAFDLPALNLTGYDFLFGLTFVLGLITLNILAVLREEGDAGREVVLEALLAPMQDIFRPMSSIPGLSFLSKFPYGFLRHVPLPGLDVALGVTAHQIAEAARVASLAALRGRTNTARVARALDEAVSKVSTAGEEARAHAVEIARHSARGAMHAAEEVTSDVGDLTHQAVVGIGRALRRSPVDLKDALRGIGYGIVQGAGETGTDLGKAVIEAANAARESVHGSGIPKKVASAQVAQGALEAAETLGPEAAAQVRDVLAEELKEVISEHDDVER